MSVSTAEHIETVLSDSADITTRQVALRALAVAVSYGDTDALDFFLDEPEVGKVAFEAELARHRRALAVKEEILSGFRPARDPGVTAKEKADDVIRAREFVSRLEASYHQFALTDALLVLDARA